MLDYQMHGDVAVLTMDDGKANAVSHAYIDALSEGLDRAEEQAKAIVLLGRAGVFSAGFDLKEIGKGPAESKALQTVVQLCCFGCLPSPCLWWQPAPDTPLPPVRCCCLPRIRASVSAETRSMG